jgi:hypothetical protein
VSLTARRSADGEDALYAGTAKTFAQHTLPDHSRGAEEENVHCFSWLSRADS